MYKITRLLAVSVVVLGAAHAFGDAGSTKSQAVQNVIGPALRQEFPRDAENARHGAAVSLCLHRCLEGIDDEGAGSPVPYRRYSSGLASKNA